MRRQFEDSGDDFDHDLNRPTRGLGGRSGRIILLGDGTEVLTDSDEQEIFDQDEEDKDLQSQVGKGHSLPDDEKPGSRANQHDTVSEKEQQTSSTPEAMDTSNPFDSPSSNTTEKSTFEDPPPPYIRAAGDSDIPTKLTTPTKEKA